MVTKTSHLPIRYFLALLWAHPILHISRVRVKSAGGWRQFSRLLAAEVCASAVVMLHTPCSEVVWRVLATHCIRQFPLHFPSRASPCAITFQLQCTTRCTFTTIHTGVAPFIFNFGIRLMWRDRLSLQLPFPDEKSGYSHWSADWVDPRARLGALGEQKLPCPSQKSNRGSLDIQAVA